MDIENKVVRYDFDEGSYGAQDFNVKAEGEYVFYDDYKELQDRLRAAESKASDFQEANGTLLRVNMCLKDENDQLRQRIETAEKQGPIAEVFKCSATGTGIDFALLNELPEGTTKLYALPPMPDKQEQTNSNADFVFNGASTGRISEGLELLFFVDGDESEHHIKIKLNDYGIQSLLASLKFFGYLQSRPIPATEANKNES